MNYEFQITNVKLEIRIKNYDFLIKNQVIKKPNEVVRRSQLRIKKLNDRERTKDERILNYEFQITNVKLDIRKMNYESGKPNEVVRRGQLRIKGFQWTMDNWQWTIYELRICELRIKKLDEGEKMKDEGFWITNFKLQMSNWR